MSINIELFSVDLNKPPPIRSFSGIPNSLIYKIIVNEFCNTKIHWFIFFWMIILSFLVANFRSYVSVSEQFNMSRYATHMGHDAHVVIDDQIR